MIAFQKTKLCCKLRLKLLELECLQSISESTRLIDDAGERPARDYGNIIRQLRTICIVSVMYSIIFRFTSLRVTWPATLSDLKCKARVIHLGLQDLTVLTYTYGGVWLIRESLMQTFRIQEYRAINADPPCNCI